MIIFVLFTLFTTSNYSYSSYASDNSISHQLLERLVTIGLLVAFYSLSEIIFQGRTIGKFITGTKAINEAGTDMDPKTILLRSLSRIVPFEAFSALGNPCRPWHDKWTRTYVIDVSKTSLNNSSLQ